eukprot:TRINITY_DN1823_c0_g1_i2.p1 TRINITY_DN1823_c0_g1~~TRINITY_DN1823_c0_g1_i2.p1  ORF type:complete len:361 (-),score=98.71 TRINITY_DN1823_c0_g1_i2:88-1170(-)
MSFLSYPSRNASSTALRKDQNRLNYGAGSYTLKESNFFKGSGRSDDVLDQFAYLRDDIRKQVTEKVRGGRFGESFDLTSTATNTNLRASSLLQAGGGANKSPRRAETAKLAVEHSFRDNSGKKSVSSPLSKNNFLTHPANRTPREQPTPSSSQIAFGGTTSGLNRPSPFAKTQQNLKTSFLSTLGFDPQPSKEAHSTRSPKTGSGSDINSLLRGIRDRSSNITSKTSGLSFGREKSPFGEKENLRDSSIGKPSPLRHSPFRREETPLTSKQGLDAWFEKRQEKSIDYFPTSKGRRNESAGQALSDQLPISRVAQLQDLLLDVPERDFGDLPPSYVEQLLRLASTIMSKVKASNHYKKSLF